MASNIGRWSAQASLDTTGFTSGVQRMQNSIRGFVQGPGGLGMLTNAGAALGIMSISSAFSNLRQTLEDEIDLAFLNDQLGTTLEWLSRLRTVASENSISQDQFSAAVQTEALGDYHG